MASAFPAPQLVPRDDDDKPSFPKKQTKLIFDKQKAAAAYLVYGGDYPKIASIVAHPYVQDIKQFFESNEGREYLQSLKEDPQLILPTHATAYAMLIMEATQSDRATDRLRALEQIMILIGKPKTAGAYAPYVVKKKA